MEQKEMTTNIKTNATLEKKKSLKYQRDRDREMVRGIFKFHEVPGGQMSFVFKAYKDDPLERYDMVDGHIYTIPRGVARHLNSNTWYPVHQYRQNEQGGQSIQIGQKVARTSFQSLEFMDIDDETTTGPLFITEASTIIR